jgi:hypothetical protein
MPTELCCHDCKSSDFGPVIYVGLLGSMISVVFVFLMRCCVDVVELMFRKI